MSVPDIFSQLDISDHEKDKLVGDVVRYILFKSEQNGGCPIKRDELTQLITGKGYKQRNLPAFVINEAKSKLSSIFGYEMRELQRSRPSANQGRATQQSSGDAKSYIIVSQLPADVYKKFVEDKNSSHLTGLTFVVIGIIHLAGGKITEENLWHHLRRLGLHENEENHPNFANTKMSLEALVQQRYLQKEKVSGPEGNTVYYELAERALDAAVNDKIKEYIAQIVQKDVTSLEAAD
ncbi:melanoma-associated antigen g1 [Phtheirospermum japonicum]|uniref:Melanoma-associated antigen g1 n=1 Tax=Phtheirospermum japonicum TaxID=374723 RepID=A0A830CPA0_9LAMI|nr:melanoma-associated antigen g1 [Phtheirospermum japonicum]